MFQTATKRFVPLAALVMLMAFAAVDAKPQADCNPTRDLPVFSPIYMNSTKQDLAVEFSGFYSTKGDLSNPSVYLPLNLKSVDSEGSSTDKKAVLNMDCGSITIAKDPSLTNTLHMTGEVNIAGQVYNCDHIYNIHTPPSTLRCMVNGKDGHINMDTLKIEYLE